MHYNFDTEIRRDHTNSIKWEYFTEGDAPGTRVQSDAAFGPNRILPMWIADMDFPAPQPVTDAILRRAAHGIYGYAWPGESYFAAIAGWMQQRHGWSIEPQWIVPTSGIVATLNLAVRTFVAPGQKVLIQTPVYHPFFSAISNNDAILVANPLLCRDQRWEMDYDDLEAKLSDPEVRLAILCSPHNPVGRVWTPEELRRFGDLCLQHQVLIVADEIHGDLILPGHTFTPLASLSDELAQNTLICSAPSKTFNLAGLKTSSLIVPNAKLRQRFEQTQSRAGTAGINVFGLAASEAAYTEGADWLDQVLDYLDGNRRALEAYLAEHLPQLTVAPLEGTYLAWIDCRALKLRPAELKQLLTEDARVYAEPGVKFGPDGEGFIRLNIACPRSILLEALDRIKAAVARR